MTVNALSCRDALKEVEGKMYGRRSFLVFSEKGIVSSVDGALVFQAEVIGGTVETVQYLHDHSVRRRRDGDRQFCRIVNDGNNHVISGIVHDDHQMISRSPNSANLMSPGIFFRDVPGQVRR